MDNLNSKEAQPEELGIDLRSSDFPSYQKFCQKQLILFSNKIELSQLVDRINKPWLRINPVSSLTKKKIIDKNSQLFCNIPVKPTDQSQRTENLSNIDNQHMKGINNPHNKELLQGGSHLMVDKQQLELNCSCFDEFVTRKMIKYGVDLLSLSAEYLEKLSAQESFEGNFQFLKERVFPASKANSSDLASLKLNQSLKEYFVINRLNQKVVAEAVIGMLDAYRFGINAEKWRGMLGLLDELFLEHIQDHSQTS